MKYKTEWDLSHLYKNEKDPQIEKDMKAIETALASFEKKYKGKDFISSPKKLLVALEDYEKLQEATVLKAWRYFALKTDLNSDDSFAGAAATRIEQRANNASNKVTFFKLEIAKIEKKKQKEYLNNQSLLPYRYSLERTFNRAQYNLSEKEEQLVSLLSQPGFGMWVDGQQKVLSQQTISFNNEELPLSKAMSILSDLPKAKRKELGDKINNQLEKNSPFAESEINAIYNYKKIMDELRGYKKPYSATVMGYENDEKTIEDLVSLVTKYFSLSNRFYTLHAKLLGEKTITNADRNVKIGTINKKFDFDSSVEIVKNAFSQLDPEYAAIARLMSILKKVKRGVHIAGEQQHCQQLFYLIILMIFDLLRRLLTKWDMLFIMNLVKNSLLDIDHTQLRQQRWQVPFLNN
jgi:oligoendopeptidase F